MSDNGIVWEDPPSQGRRGGGTDWGTVLSPLRERKGVWARVAVKKNINQAGATAAAIKNHHPGFEVISRSVDGKGYVYARYLGPEDAESVPSA